MDIHGPTVGIHSYQSNEFKGGVSKGLYPPVESRAQPTEGRAYFLNLLSELLCRIRELKEM